MPRHKQRAEQLITKSYEVFEELRAVPLEAGNNAISRFFSRFALGPRRAELSNHLQGIYALAQVHATLALADAINANGIPAGTADDLAHAMTPRAATTAAPEDLPAEPTAAAERSAAATPAAVIRPDRRSPKQAAVTEPIMVPQQVLIVSGDSLNDPGLQGAFERARSMTGEVPVLEMHQLAS